MYLCTRNYGNGSVAQLNRASDYGSEGSGFESQRSHKLIKFQEEVFTQVSTSFSVYYVYIRHLCHLSIKGQTYCLTSELNRQIGQNWTECDKKVLHMVLHAHLKGCYTSSKFSFNVCVSEKMAL